LERSDRNESPPKRARVAGSPAKKCFVGGKDKSYFVERPGIAGKVADSTPAALENRVAQKTYSVDLFPDEINNEIFDAGGIKLPLEKEPYELTKSIWWYAGGQ
jgi:hypothetical protein